MRLILLIALALLISGCGIIALPEMVGQSPIDQTRIDRGVEVYRENYCGSCHTLTVANTRGTFGPDHDDAGTEAGQYISLDNYTGVATTAADYIRESILDPTVFYTPGFESTNHHMPAFTHLPQDEIDAMVYMLMHQTR